MIDREAMAKACTSSARSELRVQLTHPLVFCPNKECEAVLPRRRGYLQCPSCKQEVCTKCFAMNALFHKDVSCKEYARIHDRADAGRQKSVTHLHEAGQAFLRQNWVASTLGPIISVETNPALLSGAPSFQKYLSGALTMGDSDTVIVNNGVFAWHGTQSDDAVVGICHHGFDPKRRSGQAYGPGEYFGQSAEVSHGYSGSTSRMLVCHLLRAPVLSTHGNF
jgi:hypothetical protein